MYRRLFVLVLIAVLGLSVYLKQPLNLALRAEAGSIESTDCKTPLFDSLGDHHHPISTDSVQAQQYFDQGLILAYSFNHAEAERSFREAARLDPDCALCYWGIALVLGPNINAGMEAEAVPKAWQALQRAVSLSETASEQEQAYIQALARRYSPEPVADRKPLDLAYANAMREIVQRYPDDLDAATLFAEALMDTMPWDYWTAAGKPKPETAEVLATLESVMARNPSHPGANHFYIHTVEAVRPELGIAAADRLRGLVPGAGHLVHMPSHIYIRVGRYHEASLANQQAIAADQAYLKQCHAQGLYPLAYVPHNYHFLWATATMEGRSEAAIEAARQVAAKADQDLMREPGYGTLQQYDSMPLYALTAFGRWDAILAEPAPAKDLRYPMGIWHYARGMAFTAKGQLDQAAQELDALRAIAADPALKEVTIWDINTTASLLQVAQAVLAGQLAAQQGNNRQAIAYLETGIELEDHLNYDEPPPWYPPVRQYLGEVLLATDRPTAAETVYREDLKQLPDNGWSLFGLTQSLLAQGKTDRAQAVQQRFEVAWQYADITLTASRSSEE